MCKILVDEVDCQFPDVCFLQTMLLARQTHNLAMLPIICSCCCCACCSKMAWAKMAIGVSGPRTKIKERGNWGVVFSLWRCPLKNMSPYLRCREQFREQRAHPPESTSNLATYVFKINLPTILGIALAYSFCVTPVTVLPWNSSNKFFWRDPCEGATLKLDLVHCA